MLPRCLSGKDSTCQSRKHGRHKFSPWSGTSPGVGNGNPLQYACLENSMNREDWRATVHGVAKSQRWLSTHPIIFYPLFCFYESFKQENLANTVLHIGDTSLCRWKICFPYTFTLLKTISGEQMSRVKFHVIFLHLGKIIKVIIYEKEGGSVILQQDKLPMNSEDSLTPP